ncbi:TetR/AcrR family transcriptional regulator [Mobilicoccus massiliensis]|uniref:TetR/AcrR family transcriptional regulator n=1 Tax=Mobilicoccus massiliensis TaxID=1522310 RepID=UPI0006938CB6|nr:TetR/AcrR family transcriptional regulator [Mobilicoccus massiliensis]
MTTRPARRGRPGHDQRAVLLAAVDAFDEYGYDATTMDQIARRLAVTKSALYHHVEGKEELLTLALDTAFEALDAGLRGVEDSSDTLDVRFETFLAEMVQILVEYRPFVRLLLRLRGDSPAVRAALDRRRDFDARMTEVIRQAQLAGLLRDDLDPAVVARLVFGAMNSTIEWYRPDGRVSPAELTDAVLTLIFRGVATSAHMAGN